MPIVIVVTSQKTSKETSFRHNSYRGKGENVCACESDRESVTPLNVGYIVISR